jgi:hypothetical protein
MPFKKINLLVITGAVLSGCAQVTPKVTQIDERVFRVATTVYSGFSVGLDSSNEGIARATIRAAANTAQSVGCPYFAAINNDSQTFRPNAAKVTEEFTKLPDGSYIYTAEDGVRFRVVRSAQRGGTFLCFKNKPTALLPGLIYNTDLVLSSTR